MTLAVSNLEHRFVRYIPEALEPGILYISVEFATVVHGCCCGCSEEVVTPLAPTEWRMTFDGETISLWPSVGNWKLPCRSHYIIDDGRVIECAAWTDEQIRTERVRDRKAKARYYGTPVTNEEARPLPQQPHESIRERIWNCLIHGLQFRRRRQDQEYSTVEATTLPGVRVHAL